MALKAVGERGSPGLTALISEGSVLAPLYSIVVLRSLYECIMESSTTFASPRRFMASSMSLCGTVSKGLSMSN